jgi:hypothetical protein
VEGDSNVAECGTASMGDASGTDTAVNRHWIHCGFPG